MVIPVYGCLQPLKHSDDGELITAALAGDEAAFSALHARHSRRLADYLAGRLSLSREEAEDVVQETWEALINHNYAALRRFEGRSKFYTYLCTIATRRAYQRQRRRPQMVDCDEADRPEPGHNPVESDLTAADVRNALKQVPEEFRTCLMLHHFGGMQYNEIAAMLGIPPNTVATRISRAKKKLAEILSR